MHGVVGALQKYILASSKKIILCHASSNAKLEPAKPASKLGDIKIFILKRLLIFFSTIKFSGY